MIPMECSLEMSPEISTSGGWVVGDGNHGGNSGTGFMMVRKPDGFVIS